MNKKSFVLIYVDIERKDLNWINKFWLRLFNFILPNTIIKIKLTN